jgi:hypothetical protein
MRGPLLSGPIGSAPALAALARWTAGVAPVVVLGPPWLGDAVARGGASLVLVETAARPIALRALRRARKERRPLQVALAAGELPLRPGTLPALVVENTAGLPPDDALRWLQALVPCLRPGGRLIAVDATSSKASAARIAGAFLAAALIGIVQEWPREGAVLTVGVAPAADITAARYGLGLEPGQRMG